MSLFYFLHAHRLLYWSVFLALFVGLLLSIAAHTRNGASEDSPAHITRADVRYVVLTVLLVFWGRFPAWLFQEQNPDESQALAAAITLLHDPRFWLSVDAGTHGPMVSVPLLTAKLFGARLDFVVSRCVGTAMLAASLALCFDVCRRRFGPLAAKLAVLPVALLISLTTNPDFMAYNGEMPVVFFLALGCWLAERALSCDEAHERRRLLLAAGFSLGLIPWVKLQGVPSAVIVAGIVLIILYGKRMRETWTFGVALAIPTVAFILYVSVIGALRDFYNGYLLFATQYGNTNVSGPEERFWAFVTWILSIPPIDAFIGPLGSVLVVLLVGYISADVRHGARRVELGVAALLFAASAYQVYRPGKPFAHYLVLLIVPLVLLLAGLLQGWLAAPSSGARRMTIAGYCAFVVIFPLFERVPGAPIAQQLTTKTEEHLASHIMRYARPGDRMLVWGWMASMHVYTQLPQAIRYADQWQIAPPTDDDEYFARTFVTDFDKAPVPLVVDAVAPLSCCLKDREKGGYETFVPLAKRIDRDYQLVWDREGLRLFVRKDRLSSLNIRKGETGG